MLLEVKPMDRDTALAAAAWKYPQPYGVYSLDSDDETLAEMTGGDFYAVFQGWELIGYFCFGKPARVPWGEENGFYAPGYIDIGLAMRPDLTGRGQGLEFFKFGLEFARAAFPGQPIRLTVASFNQRARKVYQRAGFTETGGFTVPRGMEFWIMELIQY